MNSLSEVYKHTCEVCEQENMVLHCSDKGTHHSYIPVYEELFSKYKDKPISLLEIGVNRGYSLFTWKNYFINSKLIMGIEYQHHIVHKKEGVEILYGDINDSEKILNGIGDRTFDIIIDDGSHDIKDQIVAFKMLQPKVNKGGIYIIEDLQNFDDDYNVFKIYNPKVYDLRNNKNRWDDVLFVWEF